MSLEKLPRFTDLTLVLTERCDLACSYCYVPRGRRRTMSRETALRAVDLLLDRAPARARLSLSFFGGEPFLSRGLMAEAIERARRRRRSGLRFSCPTNGRSLDEEALRLVRESRMQVALSVDEAGAADEERRAGGGGVKRLEDLRPGLERLDPIVRMTVTPGNVDRLFSSVVSLHAGGFKKIMHQPALEEPWPAGAVSSWREQHRRIADWALERRRRREPIPDLRVLEGIIGRLGSRRPARYCGAGVTNAAVDPEGRIFGCFRSVYDPRPERLVLGTLDGAVNDALIARYARLSPALARPEAGSCARCEARDGCTIFCPATGHVRLGDLRAVPGDACALVRIQVEVCQELIGELRRRERRRRRKIGASVAAAALAVSLSASGCGDSRAVSDGGYDAASETPGWPDLPAGLCAPDFMPGLCTDMTPGQCPPDMAPGVCDAPPYPDYMPPGLCDAPPQPDLVGPGLCMPPPWDWGPGLCPYIPDAGTDAPADAGVDADAGPGPGLCPIPGIC